MKRANCLFAFVLLFGTIAVTGQPHTRPAKGKEVVCDTCRAPNKGKKTAGFNDPLVSYVGRYVDSTNTRNVQNLGMRTVRAQRIRVSYPRERIFIEYGDAIAAFHIQSFLDQIGLPRIGPVGVMRTGGTPYRYGDPIELVAKPNTFFYAEAHGSGWLTRSQDVQDVLSDFDADDSGHVYVGTLSWGWGISRDDNALPDTRHMERRSQVPAVLKPNSIVAVKRGTVPYAVVSASGVVSPAKPSLLLYDTSNPWLPLLKETRNGKANGIVVWARHEPTQRLAIASSDGKLRIYTYSAFLDGGTPLSTYEPAARKAFKDLSFDENGNLWTIESGLAPAANNVLWQLKPAPNGYTKVLHNVYRSSFAPVKLAARRGWVAVGGYAAGNKTELRLYRVTNGVATFVDTGNFFFRYYHDKNPPAGYASAATYEPAYTSLNALHLLEWKGKLYLLYSADGLGDVYELKL